MPEKNIEVNYTQEMIDTLLENVPFNHDKAVSMAKELGKNRQSIVAKLKSLEADKTIKIDRPFYIAKEAYVSKTGAPVEKKGDIVNSLESILGVEVNSLKGLDKAAKAPLQKLRGAIIGFVYESVEAKSNETSIVTNETSDVSES